LAQSACDAKRDTKGGSKNRKYKTCTDIDGDGYGVGNTSACAYTALDSDDTDPSIYPGAPELCDGVDNNGDGIVDEGCTVVSCTDNDGDGYGVGNTIACTYTALDSDDTDPSIYPGALEVCDGVDNNGDGIVDEGCTVATGNIYYMSTTGNDTDSGTFTNPFKTFDYAKTQLQPGDTLIVRGGTYSGLSLRESYVANGTAEAPITIKAYDGETVLIDVSDSKYSLKGINIEVDYFIIDGFEVMGAVANEVRNKNTGGSVRSDYVTLRNLKVHDSGSHGLIVEGRNTVGDGKSVGVIVENT
jgi:hypothetical protein